MKYISIVIFGLLMLAACTKVKETSEARVDSVSYKVEIDAWRQNRVDELKAEEGWLNLAGLFWLKEGINSFGSGDDNDIRFPAGKIPARAGYFLVNQGTVSSTPTVTITQDGKPMGKGIIYSPDSTTNPTLEYGSLRWFIIQRDKSVGVRLRDLESEGVQKFKGIVNYPTDPDWRVEATVENPNEPRMIDITNVLGQTTSQASPGTLVFVINDNEYRLDALDGGKDELFLIFGDDTNASETYPSGRYVYVKRPDSEGKTILDFNKAYNPPCAFTAFATCPLPPKQNVLNLSVTAGEKKYSDTDH
jgi:uncharacterized protein (DUF1684 family)